LLAHLKHHGFHPALLACEIDSLNRLGDHTLDRLWQPRTTPAPRVGPRCERAH
jgi:hypothetical protein